MKCVLYLLVLLGLCGCSSTSKDKSSCFYAVFGVAPKPTAVVYQGKLWDNRHLLVFYELYAMVEFNASDQELATLMKGTKKEFKPFDATDYGRGLKPDELWFAPSDGSKYLGWRSEDGMYVIRSSKTKRIYAMRAEL